jgi:hypothetical protein
MKNLVRVLAILLISLTGVTTIGSGAAHAVPCGAPCAPPVTKYAVVFVTTYDNQILTDLGRVGSCRNTSTAKSCILTVTTTRSTEVGVSMGMSASWVSGEISFSLSRSTSTGAQASSGKLNAHQEFRAYATGTVKYYQIKKTVSSYYGTNITYSGQLKASQPYSSSFAFGVYDV